MLGELEFGLSVKLPTPMRNEDDSWHRPTMNDKLFYSHKEERKRTQHE